MKLRTAEGYRDGRSYTVRFAGIEMLADTEYKGSTIIPKYKLYFEGEHGRLNKLYSIPLTDIDGKGDLQPVLRPSMGFARAIQALGVRWDEVLEGELEIAIIDKKQAKAYGADWKLYPRLGDTGQQGYEPIWADLRVNGESFMGAPVIALVEIEAKSGIAGIAALTPVPED